MYEKFAICCIYDKILAGFCRVQILRKANENAKFFSPLVLFLLHYEFIFTPMRLPWNFHGICAFELFVLKLIFSYNTPYTLKWRCINQFIYHTTLHYKISLYILITIIILAPFTIQLFVELYIKKKYIVVQKVEQ